MKIRMTEQPTHNDFERMIRDNDKNKVQDQPVFHVYFHLTVSVFNCKKVESVVCELVFKVEKHSAQVRWRAG